MNVNICGYMGQLNLVQEKVFSMNSATQIQYTRENFLELFSANFNDYLHTIKLDNAGSHLSNSLTIPNNIILLFQPSYCPEVNPIERLWQKLKQKFKWIVFKDLPDLRQFLDKILKNLSQKSIASLIQWHFIIDVKHQAGILEDFHVWDRASSYSTQYC